MRCWTGTDRRKAKISDDHKFQSYLGYMLDALDMLPMRPDLAFDHLWKALDSEFFIVQQKLASRTVHDSTLF